MKVRKMVHRTFYVCIATLMYLMYDISISAGKFRHVNPPLCKAATLFIRPPSFIQMMVIAVVLTVFPVKNPNATRVKKPDESSTRITEKSFVSETESSSVDSTSSEDSVIADHSINV